MNAFDGKFNQDEVIGFLMGGIPAKLPNVLAKTKFSKDEIGELINQAKISVGNYDSVAEQLNVLLEGNLTEIESQWIGIGTAPSFWTKAQQKGVARYYLTHCDPNGIDAKEVLQYPREYLVSDGEFVPAIFLASNKVNPQNVQFYMDQLKEFYTNDPITLATELAYFAASGAPIEQIRAYYEVNNELANPATLNSKAVLSMIVSGISPQKFKEQAAAFTTELGRERRFPKILHLVAKQVPAAFAAQKIKDRRPDWEIVTDWIEQSIPENERDILREKCGIGRDSYYKYDVETLQELLKTETDPDHKAGQPMAVAFVTRSDPMHSFRDIGIDLKALIGAGYKVHVREIGQEGEILPACKALTGRGQLISDLKFYGHGTPDTLEITADLKDETAYLDLGDTDLYATMGAYMAENGGITLLSCSTGRELAGTVSRYAGRPVTGPIGDAGGVLTTSPWQQQKVIFRSTGTVRK